MFLPPAVTMMSFLRSVMREEAVAQLADVAGVEPAVRVDRLARRVGLVVVALHDVRAAREDLAVGRDHDLRRRRPACPTVPMPEVRPACSRAITGDVSVRP